MSKQTFVKKHTFWMKCKSRYYYRFMRFILRGLFRNCNEAYTPLLIDEGRYIYDRDWHFPIKAGKWEGGPNNIPQQPFRVRYAYRFEVRIEKLGLFWIIKPFSDIL